jgi:hypothetical protein
MVSKPSMVYSMQLELHPYSHRRASNACLTAAALPQRCCCAPGAVEPCYTTHAVINDGYNIALQHNQ